MSNNTNDPYELVNLPTEMWDIDKVKPYERNNKVHSDAHISKLKKSIQQDGLFDALIIDYEGVIIAGHGRYEALVALGHLKVPVKFAAHLTKSQADAARIAHNKTTSTEYDSGFLAEELARLSGADDVDLYALGLDDHELDFLVDDLGAMNADAISIDLDGDIDRQDEETKEKVAATDASEERIGKAFGFSSIPNNDVKHVRRLLAKMEQDTGKTGQDAFLEWIRTA